MESALGIGVVALDVPGDGGRGALGGLLEAHGAVDLGVPAEDSDCQVSTVHIRKTSGLDCL